MLKLKTMYCNHHWRLAILVNELFLSALLSNADFFRQMYSIKITLWSKLVIYSLNALLSIRVSGLSLVQKYVNRWCNTKKCRLREGNCKVSEKPESKILKWPRFYWFFKYFVDFLSGRNGNMQRISFIFVLILLMF